MPTSVVERLGPLFEQFGNIYKNELSNGLWNPQCGYVTQQFDRYGVQEHLCKQSIVSLN